MKPDLDIKADVIAELAWDPAINTTSIGVAVDKGVVTLSGEVDTYLKKHIAERAVRRVSGVRGIALDLEVKRAARETPTDAEIAHAAVHALRWHSVVPDDQVKVEVEDGHVILTGEVDWSHQLASAEQCVRPLRGVKSIANRITIKPRVKAGDIAGEISAALVRHAQREAKHITVEVDGGVVTLTGKVDTLPEREAAIGTAYCAKGVTRVVDRLKVGA
jgi:osmotically-inducible protein OsmY